MIVSIIAALGKNYAIGKDNQLIWHLPKDMAFFLSTTSNHFVVMGRKNYDSIPDKYRPLRNRTNVVVTRQPNFKAKGCVVVGSLEEGIRLAKLRGETECFIIGGGQIYFEALQKRLVDRMYLTHIEESFEADTYFPEFDMNQWNVVTHKVHKADEKNEFDFEILKYDRISD